MSHSVNVWYAGSLICDPHGVLTTGGGPLLWTLSNEISVCKQELHWSSTVNKSWHVSTLAEEHDPV